MVSINHKVKIMSRYAFLILLMFFSCFSVAEQNSLESELIENINKFDREKLYKIFNEIKKNQSAEWIKKAENIFLKEDYDLTKNQYFYVKVNAANIILQAYRNGNYDNLAVIKQIRTSMAEWLQSEDMDVKKSSIDLLAYYDDKESFDLLIQFISEQNDRYFSSALYSLYLLCASFDEARYRNVYQKLSERNKELSDRFENGLKKSLTDAGWCNR